MVEAVAALTVPEIIGLVGAGAAVAGTAYTIASKPGAPPTPAPAPVPPPPPPPPAPPPPPTETVNESGVAAERAKQRRQRGLASTILTSPLGIGSSSANVPLGG